MKTVSFVPPERRYYLQGATRWAVIGLATVLTAIVIVFAELLDIRVSLQELLRHHFGSTGSGHTGNLLSAPWAIGGLLWVAFLLIVIWRIPIGPHVVLDDQALWGITIWRRWLGVHISFAGIYYYEIGLVSEGQVLGLKFRRYYSREDPCVSIIVPFGVSHARECFELLDQRVTALNLGLNAPS